MNNWIWLVFILFFVSGCSSVDSLKDIKKVDEKMTTANDLAYSIKKDIEKAPPLREETYEIVVIGGEPEGIAAALSAARNGHKTLLIEERNGLGGLFTYGEMNFLDFPKGIGNRWTSNGIFKEWHQNLTRYNAFGIEEAKTIFTEMVNSEGNLSLALNSTINETIMSENKKRISGVIVNNSTGNYIVRAKKWIDATQDADFAVMAGAPYFIGGEDIGLKDKQMAVTLVMHFKNVDWNGVEKAVKSRRFGYANMNDHVAWGFSNLIYKYKPKEENTRLRGLNMARIDDDIYINALQIFNVDGLDDSSKKEAIEKGKKETEHILQFLRKEFQGFESAEIAEYPTELYVRETRHILAEYQLPMADLWQNRDHWDSIAIGGYPVDVQAQSINDLGFVISHPVQYGIPFRSLVPLEIDGLLVVGRSAGYSSLAAGSARIVATGMATGEAAGAAAALAIEQNVSFRELSKNKSLIEQLRNILKEQGAYLDHFQLDYPYQDKWYNEAILTLMDYGFLVAGYQNTLPLDQSTDSHSFVYTLISTIERINPVLYEEKVQEITDLGQFLYNEQALPLTRDKMAEILISVYEKDANVSAGYWEAAYEIGIIDSKIFEMVPSNRVLKNKEIYYIQAGIINKMKDGILN